MVNAIVWSILLGVVIGSAAMLPLVHIMRRRAEVRARNAERRAHEAERLAELGSMTSGLAHEIKNPLSTIGLNAQLLGEAIEDSELPPDQRERLRRRVDALGREAERLGRILTDFLQFAGRMQLDPQPRNLGELVDELADFFLPQCHRAGVTLRTTMPDESIEVALDERLFKQALLNLLINAVQAMTPADERIGLRAEESERRPRELMIRVEGDDEEARVHVTDTGPGIESERLKEIFHPYVSHKRGGTGLGLPTTRRIVEEHGGRLTVHSEPGQGSDFVIHLKRSTD
ncbi:MAG: two-component sensor histidine kinase [Phycisphaerales bacterium]|nr:MAG: two-component sensor histidine kinase [Phycisphaerales bacterium]